MRQLHRGLQHRRNRAVFCCGKLDCPLHIRRIDVVPAEDVLDVDVREDLRVLIALASGSCISNPFNCTRFFFGIFTTSLAVQLARANRTNSLGRGAPFVPSTASGPSIVTQWLDSPFAAKAIP